MPCPAERSGTAARAATCVLWWQEAGRDQRQSVPRVCRSSINPTAARDDLTVLRAAINHHRREGYHDRIVSVVLPERPPGRERWLTRSEAARLLLAAWRFRENQKGKATDRRTRQHVARFILVALYTGTRAGAVCAAALEPTEGGDGRSRAGHLLPPAAASAKTKKRQPPVPLPNRLLAHLRRWHRLGQRSLVEWNRRPVKDRRQGFRAVANAAGLGGRDAAHSAAHRGHLADAARHRQVGGRRVSRDDRGAVRRVYGHHHPDHLRGPRKSFDRTATASPQEARNRTRTNVVERHENRRIFKASG